MFEYEGHIQGKEIESKLECLAVGGYFMKLAIDAEGCIAITWESIAESGDFTCQAIADCITTSDAVQDALTDFIENNDFNTSGNWDFAGDTTFDGTVVFNDQVDFNNGPVNFNDLTINRDDVIFNVDNSTFNITNTDITLDAGSTFTNEGDTVLENLTVNNFTIGADTDLTGMLSTDANNCLGIGADGGLYLDCSGFGGGSSFTCADVADCIDNNLAVQNALENFIENNDFELQGIWDFQGGLTINGSPVGAVVVTGATENFLGNGVQTAFVLANPPADPDMVWVSGNGVFDQDGALLDYTVAGQTVTFNTAPVNGHKIQIKYIRNFGSVLNLWREEVPTGVINSVNTVFTLTQTPIPSSASVYLNGLRQRVTTDYTIVGTTLTFVVAPSTGATLDTHYMY